MAFSDASRIVRDKANIVDVVSRYIKLDSVGKRYRACCPFHKEKTPSFYVNEEEQFFYCFGCGAGGDAISFVMRIESLSFRETIEKIAEDFHISELLQNDSSFDISKEMEKKNIYDLNKLTARFFYKNLTECEKAKIYLAGRGLKEETQKTFGIGWIEWGDDLINFLRDKGVSASQMSSAGLVKIDSTGRLRPYFNNRIMVPIIDSRRQIIGFGGRVLDNAQPKYLNSPDTAVFNKKHNLFGLNIVKDGIKDFPYIVLTEGYFDVIALHQAGIKTALAALGTAISSDHLRLLARFDKPVVLLLDGDEAGRNAMKKVLSLEIPENLDIRAAFISQEGEDPDSLVRAHGGVETVKELIRNAIPIFQHFADDLMNKYARTSNLEEKIKIEKALSVLISKLPSRKFRVYAEYVKKQSGISLRFFPKEEKREMENLTEKPSETLVETNIKTIFREIFYLAAKYPYFIPALQEIESLDVRVFDVNNMLATIMEFYYSESIPDAFAAGLDSDGILDTKYSSMTTDALERSFQILMNDLKYFDLDIKRGNLKKDSSEEGMREFLKITEKMRKIKEEKYKLKID